MNALNPLGGSTIRVPDFKCMTNGTNFNFISLSTISLNTKQVICFYYKILKCKNINIIKIFRHRHHTQIKFPYNSIDRPIYSINLLTSTVKFVVGATNSTLNGLSVVAGNTTRSPTVLLCTCNKNIFMKSMFKVMSLSSLETLSKASFVVFISMVLNLTKLTLNND